MAGRAPRRAIVTVRSPGNGHRVVRPADSRREPRLIRSVAAARVSGGNLGVGDLALGAPLYRGLCWRGWVTGGLFAVPCSTLWENAGRPKRGQLPADLLGQRQAHPANAQVSGVSGVSEFSALTRSGKAAGHGSGRVFGTHRFSEGELPQPRRSLSNSELGAVPHASSAHHLNGLCGVSFLG
jgi:hypothetical protein